MTQEYIGVKQVTAWEQKHKDGREGYAVKYEDGYISWSPKETFEKFYLPMGHCEDASKVNQGMVDAFIAKSTSQTVGEKTTLVSATLRNGFEIVEASSCVDAKNYSEELGANICRERVKNKVWELLGFALQWARNGLT